MKYNISEIAEVIGVGRPVHPEMSISHLLTDSRSLTYPSQSLFFAIKTSSGDGHRYVRELYDKGVRNFVISERPEGVETMPEANFMTVPDTLAALQKIGAHHRRKFNIPVIAVTGSRGKTTVKEWLNQLLRDDFTIVRSPRSYNSQIGVPLSVWQIEPDTTLGIFEAGISRPGEMQKLHSVIAPEIGILTNVGSAHSEGFASRKEKCEEKATLLRGCKCVIYNADDDIIAEVMQRHDGEAIAWSTKDKGSKLFISGMEKSQGRTTLSYSFDNGAVRQVTIPFTNDRDIENAIISLAVMLHLGIAPQTIGEKMKSLSPIGTRLEVIEGVNNCQLIHDSYTSDYSSLIPALDFMKRRMTADHKATVILSDLMHDCSEPSTLYANVAALLRNKGIDRMIGIGKEIMRHKEYFGDEAEFFESTDDFLKKMSEADFSNEVILYKSAPQFDFSKIGELLEARQHETVLEINLDAIVDNLNAIRSRLRPTTGMVCMIKASGYGVGADELAKTLQWHGVNYLAVAVHDEGADLRQAGITMPIMVLNPAVENFKALFDNQLEPEIYSLDFLKRLINEASRLGIKNYPVHIKIDSGMHRLGFLKETLPELIETLKGQDSVMIKSVFSHLSSADNPMEDAYTQQQFDYFDECCERLQAEFPDHHILRHILNSTGITRFPEHQHDMVRLGIGLYGIKTMHDGSQDDLRPVSSLHTTIISLKRWPAGTTVGYNRLGKLERDSVIATIPIGYADGINRHLGRGNSCMMVRGVKCPTVGNICMDACMLDVTDVPDVHVGDRVEVFGENMPIDTIAEILGTIPYEVLTSISQRVKRVYYRE